MKKQIILQICSFLFPCFLFGQEMEIKWQYCYGGSENEVVYDIIADNDNFFIIGSTVSIDGDVSFNHGAADAWIIKTDTVGNIIWEKTYGGSNGEWFTKMIPISDGMYYLIGATASSDGDISYDPYPGSRDIWVVKIDSVGNLIWDKIVGGETIDLVYSCILTNDSSLAIFGYTGSQTGDVSINYGMYDMWLVKLDSNGEIEWDKSYGTDDFDWGIDIIQTSDGGFILGGFSTIGNGGNLNCEPFNFDAEAVIIKTDSRGNIEWQNCYGGSDSDGFAAIIETKNGYILSGYGGSSDGDLNGSGWHGESDVWVVKTDFFGNIIWQKCYGGSMNETPISIFKTTDNCIVIFAPAQSRNGDITNNHSTDEFDNDIWFLKIDSIGEIITQKCFGGVGNEFLWGNSVVQISDNRYLIGARTNLGPSYDVACTPYGGNYDEDIWVFEIKDCSGLYASTPARPLGPHVVCSSLTPQSTYYVHTATLAQTYEWSVYPAECGTLVQQDTTISITWAAGWEGDVALRARALNECGPSEWSVTHYADVHTCIGIAELSKSGIAVWPNPANDILNIALPQNMQLPIHLTLTDLTGRVLLTQQLTQAQTAINLSKLPQGVFFCHLASTEINVTAKIVKGL